MSFSLSWYLSALLRGFRELTQTILDLHAEYLKTLLHLRVTGNGELTDKSDKRRLRIRVSPLSLSFKYRTRYSREGKMYNEKNFLPREKRPERCIDRTQ